MATEPGDRSIQIARRSIHASEMSQQDRRHAPRQLTEKEMAMLRTQRDRQERYIRTALFVQSKWFMIGGAVGIALFLLMIYLLSR